jgi:hypothetical protein
MWQTIRTDVTDGLNSADKIPSDQLADEKFFLKIFQYKQKATL